METNSQQAQEMNDEQLRQKERKTIGLVLARLVLIVAVIVSVWQPIDPNDIIACYDGTIREHVEFIGRIWEDYSGGARRMEEIKEQFAVLEQKHVAIVNVIDRYYAACNAKLQKHIAETDLMKTEFVAEIEARRQHEDKMREQIDKLDKLRNFNSVMALHFTYAKHDTQFCWPAIMVVEGFCNHNESKRLCGLLLKHDAQFEEEWKINDDKYFVFLK